MPFGSYGLGGYIRNADIDIVLVCSQSIKRRDFFKFFPNTLRQLATIRDIEVSNDALQPNLSSNECHPANQKCQCAHHKVCC